MEYKHTPGPWRIGVRQSNSDKFIYGANGGEVANCDRLINFADENLANARLIAAAPDLLDLLILAAQRVEVANEEGNPILSAWLTDANAAIAKATTN